MFYGYCRVSTKGQAKEGYSLDNQEQEIIAKYNSAVIFKEAYTGTTTERPVFTELINQMVSGDTLIVTKLDRLARNTVEGIEIVKELFAKGCSVHVLNVGLLEDTSMGQFFITTLLAVAELERNQIIERTQSGKAIAKLNPDFKEGRPKALNDALKEDALAELNNGKTYKEVAEKYNISKRTLMRYKKELG